MRKDPLIPLIVILLVFLLVSGCESLQERASKLNHKRSSERRDAVRALEALVSKYADKKQEALPANLQEKLKLVAAKASYKGGDPDPQVRATALAFLGRCPFWKDWSIFVTALSDPAMMCKFEAIRALRLKKVKEAAAKVIPFLQRGNPFLLRTEALAYVRDLRIKQAIGPLVAIVTDMVERNELAVAAWTTLRELTGQNFSCEDFISWRRWYEGYKSGLQESESGVGSEPASGKGSGGGEPPEKR